MYSTSSEGDPKTYMKPRSWAEEPTLRQNILDWAVQKKKRLVLSALELFSFPIVFEYFF